MVADSLIVFDHVFSTVRCVSHVHLPDSVAKNATAADVEALYNKAQDKVNSLISALTSPTTPLPEQPAILTNQEAISNVGKAGYEGFVTSLRKNIVKGDLFKPSPPSVLPVAPRYTPSTATDTFDRSTLRRTCSTSTVVTASWWAHRRRRCARSKRVKSLSTPLPAR